MCVRAFRTAASVDGSPVAWENLMQMYVAEGCVKEALAAAHEYLEAFEGSSSWEHSPPSVEECVYALVSEHGLQKARSCHHAVHSLV